VRRLGIALGAFLSVLVVGAAAWGVVAGPRPGAPRWAGPAVGATGQGAPENVAVHGGPIQRFHRAGACDLVAVSGLPGNWTHGDYVSAVEALGDPALIPEAARSDCGKPMVAVERGGGPPAHALENRERARERAEEARAHAPAETPTGS
jgi:hypothetical protein